MRVNVVAMTKGYLGRKLRPTDQQGRTVEEEVSAQSAGLRGVAQLRIRQACGRGLVRLRGCAEWRADEMRGVRERRDRHPPCRSGMLVDELDAFDPDALSIAIDRRSESAGCGAESDVPVGVIASRRDHVL